MLLYGNKLQFKYQPGMQKGPIYPISVAFTKETRDFNPFGSMHEKIVAMFLILSNYLAKKLVKLCDLYW